MSHRRSRGAILQHVDFAPFSYMYTRVFVVVEEECGGRGGGGDGGEEGGEGGGGGGGGGIVYSVGMRKANNECVEGTVYFSGLLGHFFL